MSIDDTTSKCRSARKICVVERELRAQALKQSRLSDGDAFMLLANQAALARHKHYENCTSCLQEKSA